MGKDTPASTAATSLVIGRLLTLKNTTGQPIQRPSKNHAISLKAKPALIFLKQKQN
jgi:hypothetical protein